MSGVTSRMNVKSLGLYPSVVAVDSTNSANRKLRQEDYYAQ